MESKSITKQFHSYLWAFILVALSACMGNVVDGIIVGNLISEDGVSAINLSKPINQFIFTLHLLINAGAGMLVAFALGRNNLAEARRYFTRALSLSACLGLLLTIFGGLLFPDATARMLCSNDHILPLANDYMRVLLIGSPVYILMFGLSTMVGVDGKPKLVSLAVIVDNVLNLFLDIVFIKWFDWGIAGSSSATVVGHVVGIAILLTHWWKPENRRLRFDFSLSDSVPARSLYGKIISQGAPLAIASICLTLLLFSANSIVLSTLGRTGIFAFAVCMNLLQIYNLFLSGTCQTLQSLGAVQAGKGDEQGLRMVLRHAFRFITVAMIVTCVYVLVWPQSIVYRRRTCAAHLLGQFHPLLLHLRHDDSVQALWPPPHGTFHLVCPLAHRDTGTLDYVAHLASVAVVQLSHCLRHRGARHRPYPQALPCGVETERTRRHPKLIRPTPAVGSLKVRPAIVPPPLSLHPLLMT